MPNLLGFLIAFFGLFVGLLIWSRAVRWIFGLWVAFRAPREEKATQPSASSFLALALLNSAPWLLATVIAFAWFILSRPHPELWHWFFGGMLATPLLIALNCFCLCAAGACGLNALSPNNSFKPNLLRRSA